MSNKLLTPTQVLREALRVLHNNLVFVKNVNKQYSAPNSPYQGRRWAPRST